MPSKKIIFLIIIFEIVLKSCTAQDHFYVNSFGAKGDGVSDDTEAINNCFMAALQCSNSIVVFGKGNYRCHGRLNVEFKVDNKVTIQGESVATRILFDNLDIDRGFFIRSDVKSFGKGTILLRNFKIIGPALGLGKKNKFFNSLRHSYGVGISNIKNVEIDGIEVNGFYGNGVDISNKESRAVSKLGFQKVEIRNCNIVNVWGYSPSDSYGDGIYLSDCNNFAILNNNINNGFKHTESLGRGGIVVEDFTKNGIIYGNIISGYDRGIHIENSLGNIALKGNRFLDNRVSFYLWSNGLNNSERPVNIQSNYFRSSIISSYLDKVALKNKDRAYIVILREKPIDKLDKIENNKFLLDASINNKSNAIKGNTSLSLLNNSFKK
ncbi:right-handed parallel beta-helix repeat-containing protein [Sphingobacterium athyrii]|nr:right-handed parallel beta-helix repeat-containing protein [Sphingobacterium athyrii]